MSITKMQMNLLNQMNRIINQFLKAKNIWTKIFKNFSNKEYLKMTFNLGLAMKS